MNLAKLNKVLGPGLLYAAAAVGVSHLVQSTRAGAQFGFFLIVAIVLCHLIKYPFFKIAPLYTHATGKTLLEGYKGIGKWAIPLFFIMTLLTMFIIQAAVTIVTAGISLNILNIQASPISISITLLLITGLILQTDKYKWLDSIVKVIIIVLTLTTIVSVAIAFIDSPSTPVKGAKFNFEVKAHLLFLAALIGWMPAPMDVPIWHSLWTKAKQQADGEQASPKEASLDFSVGYFGTALLAIGFLSLGTLVMYGKEDQFASGAVGFASQLIKLYTSALGDWSYPVIAIASFATMFSTTLTCLDAFPRILTEASNLQLTKRVPSQLLYRYWLLITILGTSFILVFFTKNMKSLVDFATTLSFTIAPIYAYLNFRVISAPETPDFLKYHGNWKWYPIICLAIMTIFSLYYLKIQFF